MKDAPGNAGEEPLLERLRVERERFEGAEDLDAAGWRRISDGAWRALAAARAAEAERRWSLRSWLRRLAPLAFAAAAAALFVVVRNPPPSLVVTTLGDESTSASELIETLDPPALARLNQQLEHYRLDDETADHGLPGELDPVSELSDEALPRVARRLGGG